jgi:hypothetical protein
MFVLFYFIECDLLLAGFGRKQRVSISNRGLAHVIRGFGGTRFDSQRRAVGVIAVCL